MVKNEECVCVCVNVSVCVCEREREGGSSVTARSVDGYS